MDDIDTRPQLDELEGASEAESEAVLKVRGQINELLATHYVPVLADAQQKYPADVVVLAHSYALASLAAGLALLDGTNELGVMRLVDRLSAMVKADGASLVGLKLRELAAVPEGETLQ